jgi:hypothetical protein
LNELLLLLCLEGVSSDLTRGIEGVAGGCKHESLLVMVVASC